MEESPMVFEHALVNRSWLSYEIGKSRPGLFREVQSKANLLMPSSDSSEVAAI